MTHPRRQTGAPKSPSRPFGSERTARPTDLAPRPPVLDLIFLSRSDTRARVFCNLGLLCSVLDSSNILDILSAERNYRRNLLGFITIDNLFSPTTQPPFLDLPQYSLHLPFSISEDRSTPSHWSSPHSTHQSGIHSALQAGLADQQSQTRNNRPRFFVTICEVLPSVSWQRRPSSRHTSQGKTRRKKHRATG